MSGLRLSVANYHEAVPAGVATENYALVRFEPPASRERPQSTSAEIVLVLDYSASMQEVTAGETRSNIEKVIDAARTLANSIGPADRMAIVVFDDAAQTICPLIAGEQRQEILLALDEFEKICDTGGSTAMVPALKEAMAVLGDARDPHAARIVVLTDGEAWDERDALVQVARMERQSIAALGFGEFNFDFMNEVCAPSKGIVERVGDDGPARVEEIFQKELKVAQDTLASNVRLTVKPSDDVQLLDHYVVRPNTTFLGPVQLGRSRECVVDLPVVQHGGCVEVLLSMLNSPRDPGAHEAVTLTLEYDVPGASSSESLEGTIVVEYSTDVVKTRLVDNQIAQIYDECFVEKKRLEGEMYRKDGDLEALKATMDTIIKVSDDPETIDAATVIKDELEANGEVSPALAESLQYATRVKE